LTDEGLLKPGPSTLKVVEKTASVEGMKEVSKAVGLNLRSIFWIPENVTKITIKNSP
jgi:hypothetical protein